jgi:hypothetical protein
LTPNGLLKYSWSLESVSFGVGIGRKQSDGRWTMDEVDEEVDEEVDTENEEDMRT